MIWDEGDDSLPDDEVTKDTEAAFAAALAAAEDQLKGETVYCKIGAELRILASIDGETGPPIQYVAIFRGQSSAAGNGKHGTHPERVDNWGKLTDADGNHLNAWVCFVESGAQIAYSGWKHALPEAVPISKAKGAQSRWGWMARKDQERHDAQLFRTEGVRFPESMPGPEFNLFTMGGES